MPINSFAHNRRGMALLNMVFIFIFIGVLAVAGVKMYGSIVARGKINDTKGGLENQVKIIVAWAAKNGRLPTGGEYPSVFGGAAPLDAWGKPIAYIYDTTLTSATTGGLCGSTSTTLTDSGTNMAFALVSGGEDHTIDTKVSGVTVPGSGAQSGAITNYQTDLYRAVPLEEMKNKAGCYGPTGGKLALLNNELPRVCVSTAYNVSVYATGGVPFNSSEYKWCASGTFPGTIVAKGAAVAIPACPTYSTASYANIQLTGTAPATPPTPNPAPITFKIQDSQGNIAERTYTINTGYCYLANGRFYGSDPTCGNAIGGCAALPPQDPNIGTAPPAVITPTGSQISLTGNSAGFLTVDSTNTNSVSNNANTTFDLGWLTGDITGCIWYQTPQLLGGNTMRAFFNFQSKYADVSGNSTQYGDGFTFATVQAAGTDPNTTCGYANAISGQHGEFLGFYGLRHNPSTTTLGTINGDSIAVEFDTYPNTGSRNDPANNHVAIVKDGDNTHNTTTPNMGNNPACSGTLGSGCYYTGTTTWLENALLHDVRVEMKTNCSTNTCASCGLASGSYSQINAWIDSGNSDLRSNYGTAPTVQHCFLRPASMDNVYFGFTVATGAAVDNYTISNFGIAFTPCTLTASPTSVHSGGTSTVTWSITGGASDGTWAASPGGTCANFTGSTGGSCTTGAIAATTNYALNIGSRGSCTTSVTSCPVVSLPTTPLSGGTVGTSYSGSVAGTGQSPITYTRTSGTLPTGLSLDASTGEITGTPTAAGTYTFTIRLADSCGDGSQTTTQAYTITICAAFTGWSGSLQAATNCQSYTDSTTVVGGVSPFGWALSSGAIPSGLSFCTGNTSATCTINGTPLAAPGTYNFTEQVTDSCAIGSQSTNQSFSLTVTDAFYAGGMSVRNQTGATRGYRTNGGACTSVNNGNTFTVMPGDSVIIYTSNTCATIYCATPVTYCQQVNVNTDADNQTNMTGICTYTNR